MRVIITKGGCREEMEVPEHASSVEVLDRLCLLPDAHIILRGGVPIPVDERLEDGDTLRIVKVASGG
ncbi:MAG: hypothetical protein SA339_10015 [Methanomassiliicoccus sp.]|nr:hypothetical protein [Methanomassiliicoccus sp.]